MPLLHTCDFYFLLSKRAISTAWHCFFSHFAARRLRNFIISSSHLRFKYSYACADNWPLFGIVKSESTAWSRSTWALQRFASAKSTVALACALTAISRWPVGGPSLLLIFAPMGRWVALTQTVTPRGPQNCCVHLVVYPLRSVCLPVAPLHLVSTLALRRDSSTPICSLIQWSPTTRGRPSKFSSNVENQKVAALATYAYIALVLIPECHFIRSLTPYNPT